MVRSNLRVLIAQAEQEQGRRLTYERIGNEANLSKNTIAHLATGDVSMVALDTLDKLCKFFDCDVCDLLAYVPDPAASPDGRDGHESETEAVPAA